MSELNKLVGKGKKFKIGELELDINPLTVSSLPLFMQIEKNPDVIRDIFKVTLKNAIPDATDTEIDNIAVEYAIPLIEAIMEVNQFEMDTEKTAFLKQLKNGGPTKETRTREK